MIIIFIPLELIFIFLFLAAATVTGAVNSLLSSLPWLLTGAVVGLIMTGIHMLIRFYRQKTENILFTIGEIIMILWLVPGALFWMELTALDRCGSWMAYFGDSQLVRLLTILAVIVLGCFILMTIAAIIPLAIVRIPVLLLSILFPFGLYFHGLNSACDSYSTYIATDFTAEDTVQECTVIRDTAIYYPTLRTENRMPMILPADHKYTKESFESGEIVYLLMTLEDASANGYEYIPVSNGEKGGYVSVADLELNNPPVYTYGVQVTAETADIYACKVEEIHMNDNVLTTESRQDNVIATLSSGEVLNVQDEEDGYLMIYMDNGEAGYISCSDVGILRTENKTE